MRGTARAVAHLETFLDFYRRAGLDPFKESLYGTDESSTTLSILLNSGPPRTRDSQPLQRVMCSWTSSDGSPRARRCDDRQEGDFQISQVPHNATTTGLNHTAYRLAVYASQSRPPVPTQDSLPAGDHDLRRSGLSPAGLQRSSQFNSSRPSSPSFAWRTRSAASWQRKGSNTFAVVNRPEMVVGALRCAGAMVEEVRYNRFVVLEATW